MSNKIVPLLAVCLVACASTVEPASRVSPGVASVASDPVLARVDGVPIHRSHLEPEVEQQLKKIDNEAKQRAFHTLWTGVDEAIARSLMHREAARQGTSVEQLRQKEILAKVAEPSDDEVRRVYDDNRDRIGVSFDMAQPILKRQMAEDRREEQEAAYVKLLRQAADIRHSVPAPDLPRFDVDAGDSPALGNKDARVTLIEFSDFECPYCGRAHSLIKRLAELYPHDLRIVFRDFPLRQHPRARAAAEAARCAHQQGKFWPYHDLLFANTGDLEDSDLERYAQELSLDLEAFAACRDSQEAKQAVAADIAAAERYGVSGTPAIFINGIKLMGLLPLPLMQALIDSELER